MVGNSKVAPANSSHLPDDELKYLFDYVNTKACYRPLLLEETKIINKQQKVAFIVEMWTLVEKRWVDWKEKPDDGNTADGEDIGDVFGKYEYEAPETLLTQVISKNDPLTNTRKRLSCPSCDGNGMNQCKLCSGTGKLRSKDCLICSGQGNLKCKRCSQTGKIIRWGYLKIEWKTVQSVDYYQNTFLPNQFIKSARLKTVVFNGDDECKEQSLDSTFPHLLREVYETSPVDFRPFLMEKFQKNHLNRLNGSMRIRRVKCVIQKVDILAVQYQSGTYVNPVSREGPHVFQFLLYDKDHKDEPQIYEDSYPAIGCCGVNCACIQNSKICTIS